VPMSDLDLKIRHTGRRRTLRGAGQRRNAYRDVRAALDAERCRSLSAGERDLLRLLAEDLALAPAGDELSGEAARIATELLSALVSAERVSEAVADELWRRIERCRPVA
jgi:hypothetical protein